MNQTRRLAAILLHPTSAHSRRSAQGRDAGGVAGALACLARQRRMATASPPQSAPSAAAMAAMGISQIGLAGRASSATDDPQADAFEEGTHPCSTAL